MSETVRQRKDTDVGDPESEWDAVVRRISERIKKKQEGANASGTQSNLDLAGEMVRLERRALDAETTLARERDAYTARVKEMEDKLRHLEPWLRQLKGEYQKAANERDQLREELKRASSRGTGSPDTTSTLLLASEREAAIRDAEAARAARDSAIAEIEMLRKQGASDRANPSESWQRHIAAAEKARDEAVAEANQLRKAVGDARRSETEIKRLLTEIRQLETTTAAHKAVARAAQEEAESLRTRVAQLEKAGKSNAANVQLESRRVEELGKDIDLLRDELATLRATEEAARREAAEKSKAYEDAKRDVEAARKDADSLRADAEDARRQAEASRGESSQEKSGADRARREAESAADASRRAAAALEAATAAEKQARDAAAAAAKDAAEAKELAEEAMRAEGEAKRRADELAAKLASVEPALAAESQRVREMDARAIELAEHLAAERNARQEAERRANEFDVRAEQAEPRVRELEGQIEIVGGRVRAAEAQNAGLARALEEERAAATKRTEAAEASWRSQMRAAEGRFEAELQRERNRTFESDQALESARDRHARAAADRDAAVRLATAKAREVLEGLQEYVVAVTPEAQPITMGITMGMDGLVMPAAAAASSADEDSTAAPADFDRLIEDVSHLRGEVEVMRSDGRPGPYETAEVLAEAVAEPVDAAAAPDGKAEPVEAAQPAATAEPDQGKKKKKKK